MTAIQLSKVYPWTTSRATGEVGLHPYEAPRRPSQNGKRVFYLRSYINVNKILNDWEDSEENRKAKKNTLWKPLWQRLAYGDRTNHSDIWLPADARRKPIKKWEDQDRLKNLEHDLGVSDFYAVLYACTENGKPVMDEWDRSSDLYNTIRYDARFKMFGYTFYYEHERGNHPILQPNAKVTTEYSLKSLNHKINKYAEHFRSHAKEKPMLLMDFEICYGNDYDAGETNRWVTNALRLVADKGLEGSVLIAIHRDVVGNKDAVEGEIHNDAMGLPLGEVWQVTDGPKMSLLELP